MLQFSVNGRRYTVRLSLPPSALHQVRLNVRRLVECRMSGVQPDAALRGWAESTTGRLRQRLADAGLVVPEADTALGPYCAARIETFRCGDKARARYRDMAEAMAAMWGASRPVQSLTPADGAKFAESLGPDGNRRRRKLARARRLLPDVFAGLPLTLWDVPDKKQFVSREIIERLMDAAHPEFAAVLALCRWAGLRCPSEVKALRWVDVDWEQGRLAVTDVKRHRTRQCPLFPEVRDALQSLCGRDDSGFIVERYRGERLSSVLQRLQKRCGVVPWRAPFHSLRSSCQTELEREFGIVAACEWLGNSSTVAARSYLRAKPKDWEKATRPAADGRGEIRLPENRAAASEVPVSPT